MVEYVHVVDIQNISATIIHFDRSLCIDDDSVRKLDPSIYRKIKRFKCMTICRQMNFRFRKKTIIKLDRQRHTGAHCIDAIFGETMKNKPNQINEIK